MLTRTSKGKVSLAFGLIASIAALCGGARAQISDIADFASSPQFFGASLSPDGQTLSYVQYASGRESLVLMRVREHRVRRPLSLESKQERFGWCDWASNRFILCGTASAFRKPERVEVRTRLYAIDAVHGETRELNRRLSDPIRDHIIGFSARGPHRVLVQHDPKRTGYPEIAELDVETGRLTRILRSRPPIRRWMADYRGEVKLGIAYDAARASFYVRDDSSENWTVLNEQDMSDPEAIAPLSIGAGNNVYVLKHHRGRAALFRADATNPKFSPELVFADPKYDIVGPVILDRNSGELLAVRYVQDSELQAAFTQDEVRRQAWLDARLPDSVNLISDRSDDGRWLLVESSSDRDPPSTYLFDTEQANLILVGHSFPKLEGKQFPPMQSITYSARDGQRIPGYLTLPFGAQTKGLPAIVLPHGGPEARTWKRFDPLVHFLVQRGYGVLQMNFRGSLGYGAGFAAAGAGQWGGVIHNDITDGARWLVEQGTADPTRMCIAGASFGGYASLLGATRESQWYACAASFGGISDLLAFSQHTQRLADADVWRERLGADGQGLWQMSPIARVRSTQTPVLLVHGLLDAVVPASQSRRFARALRKEGKPHELIMRADCDHGMTIESCRTAYFKELSSFLNRHIGPSPAGVMQPLTR